MPTVEDLLQTLERIAPSRYAFSFDKVGLQVGNPDTAIERGVVSLDRSLGAVEHCKELGANVLVAHHPLIFTPISSVDTRSHVGRTVLELAASGIAFVAAHTNWDSAKGGVNDVLASTLGLSDVVDFGGAADVDQYKLVVLCPLDAAEALVDAASAAGAGVIGAYRRCAFQSEGTGTFEPQEGANPYIGRVGERESVPEARIEMIVPAHAMRSVERAIRKTHPYDEPAYDFFALAAIAEQPIGRMGLTTPSPLKDFARHVEVSLDTRCWTWGEPGKTVRRVAVVGGGADDEWRAARNAGADVLITGEVHQHVALEAVESGMCLIAAGHFATEQLGCQALRDRLAKDMPGVAWTLFEPQPGRAGRPF